MKLKATFGNDGGNYHLYRPRYPSQLFNKIFEYIKFQKDQCALDIGAGSGLSTIPLISKFSKIIAVEPNKKLALELLSNLSDCSNCRIYIDLAEEIELSKNSIRLITFGNSFYWTDGKKLLDKASEWLNPDGIISTYRYGFPKFQGELDRFINQELITKWDEFRHERLRDENYSIRTISNNNKYFLIDKFEIKNEVVLKTEQLVGFLLSTSYCSKYVEVNKNKNVYEKYLIDRISDINENDEYIKVDFSLELLIAKRN